MCQGEKIGGREVSFRQSVARAPSGTAAAVLLHRAGGSSRDWHSLFESLGAERCLVAPDLPGHGRSPGPGLTSIDQMADLTALLLERLELGPVVAIGHSMGGAVALTLALNHPDRVSKLLLFASGAKLRVAHRARAALLSSATDQPQLWESISRQRPRRPLSPQ